MSPRTLALVALTLVAFASNSLLCRLALRDGAIDWASFTSIRLASGAVALWILVAVPRRRSPLAEGSARMAGALVLYAVAFSFAYLELNAGTGALVLFGAVQATMIAAGIVGGERPTAWEWLGLAGAVGGLVYLVSPGLEAPDPLGAASMAMAGVAWGFYSLWGRGVPQPGAATAGNFVRAAPFGLIPLALLARQLHVTSEGVLLAAVSGAFTSGVGYVIWYQALRGLTATRAAVVQLAVPIVAAFGGVLLLGESLTWRLGLASVVTLGGVGIAVFGRSRRR
ncbi:MAG: DMT family transporter [Fimbriimonadaceae bacterium]|nr:DMT family transporter [Fimbriimonadaceae bacterium]